MEKSGQGEEEGAKRKNKEMGAVKKEWEEITDMKEKRRGKARLFNL